MAMKPAAGSVARYLAKKTDQGWSVAFGRFNEKCDKFLIVYEATQGASAKEFNGSANGGFAGGANSGDTLGDSERDRGGHPRLQTR